MNHLTYNEMESYAARSLTASQLLEADDHLAVCTDCRETLRNIALLHPNTQHLATYAYGSLAEPDQSRLSAHVSVCKRCADEVAELRAAEADLNTFPLQQRQRSTSLTWPMSFTPLRLFLSSRLTPALLGAAVTAIAATVLFVRPLNTELAQFKRLPLGPTHPASEHSSVASEALRLRHDNDRLLMENALQRTKLNSYEKQVTGLTSKVKNLSQSPQSLKPAIAGDDDATRLAKETGRINIPSYTMDYTERSHQVSGLASPPKGVALVSPVNTAITSAQPVLKWSPVAGATGYDVVVFDGDHVVAKSIGINTTEWSVPLLLRRGRTYRWKVSPLVDGAASSEARFHLLTQGAVAAVLSAEDVLKSKETNVHEARLTLSIAYMRAGMLKQATQLLGELNETSPPDVRVQRLLQRLRALDEKNR